MKINDKIREIRKVLGLSRKKFSEACGLSLTAISYFENGDRIPCEESLRKIIETFHINPEKFYRDVDIHSERRTRRIYIDEKWLKRQYVDKKLPASEIANLFGYSKSTILSRLRECDIPRRPKFGHTGPQKPEIDGGLAALLNSDGNILREICKEMTEREEIVFKKRLGLDGEKVCTLEEIGKEFNLTRERIRQIQNIALFKAEGLVKHKSLKKLA